MNQRGVPAPGFVKRIGEIIDHRRGVDYQELRSQHLMNRLSGEGMPFDWTINPFRGCEIGCRYCYARPTHEFLGHADPLEFEERIYVKRLEGGTLLPRLRRARARGQEIAIGTATDPYQPAESRFGVTRFVLEAVRQVPGLRLGLTTKSASVTRDLDVLREIAGTSSLTVNISLISLEVDLLRLIEPRAPRPDLRLRAMEELAGAGVPTRLFAMPLLPLITDGAASLGSLLRAASRAGASTVVWNVLFLRGSTRQYFLEFVRQEFPWALPRYIELYGDAAAALRLYRVGLDRLMTELAREAGLAGRSRDDRARMPEQAPRQLSLVW